MPLKNKKMRTELLMEMLQLVQPLKIYKNQIKIKMKEPQEKMKVSPQQQMPLLLLVRPCLSPKKICLRERRTPLLRSVESATMRGRSARQSQSHRPRPLQRSLVAPILLGSLVINEMTWPSWFVILSWYTIYQIMILKSVYLGLVPH